MQSFWDFIRCKETFTLLLFGLVSHLFPITKLLFLLTRYFLFSTFSGNNQILAIGKLIHISHAMELGSQYFQKIIHLYFIDTSRSF